MGAGKGQFGQGAQNGPELLRSLRSKRALGVGETAHRIKILLLWCPVHFKDALLSRVS